MKVLQVLKLSFALLLLQLVFLSGCKKTNQNPTNTPSVPRLAYYIDSKIMVMNADEHSFDSLVEYNLEPEIYSLHIFHSFHQ